MKITFDFGMFRVEFNRVFPESRDSHDGSSGFLLEFTEMRKNVDDFIKSDCGGKSLVNHYVCDGVSGYDEELSGTHKFCATRGASSRWVRCVSASGGVHRASAGRERDASTRDQVYRTSVSRVRCPSACAEVIEAVSTVFYEAPVPFAHDAPAPMSGTSRQRRWCDTGSSGKCILSAPGMEYQRKWWSPSCLSQQFPTWHQFQPCTLRWRQLSRTSRQR